MLNPVNKKISISEDVNVAIDCENPVLDVPACGFIDIRYADDANGLNIVSIPIATSKYISFTTDGGVVWSPWKQFVGNDGQSGGGDTTLTQDVEVIGVGTVGAVSDGYIFYQGQDLTTVLIEIMQKTNPPTYTQPTLEVALSPGGPVEVNSVQDIFVFTNFTQNDAGPITLVSIYRDSVLISSQTTTAVYEDQNLTVNLGNTSYSSKVDYSDGPIKNDNMGNPNPNGRILAGSITAHKTLVGAYYNCFGPINGLPSTGDLLKAITDNSFSNSFTLNTGTTHKTMAIAIPSTKTLVSVIDLNNGFNITSSYEYTSDITTLPDGGGVQVSYKVYVLNIASTYAVNHKHKVTVN
jgi:hypothetical protein